MIGTTIGTYRITAKLGAGGMGEVYRATDTKLKRDVALKVLPEAFARDPERLARFEREAEVLASLNHPNIAAIYGVVEDRALVMELVEGAEPKGPLPFDEAWAIMSQVAAALDYAHEKGVVHRDLKPANIKVTPDGQVKLLDFGLAKAFSPKADAQSNPENSPTLTIGVTQVGVILGTAAYMSPEQAKGKNVDKRADIWAFGVVLYEILTGKALFGGETVSDILVEVLGREPEVTALPIHARYVVERCLRKDARKRWQAIGDVRVMLEEGLPALSSPASAVDSKRSVLRWTAASALLLVTAAASFVALNAMRSTSVLQDLPLIRLDTDLGPELHAGAAYAASVAAISPDGTRLVYPVRGQDGKQLLAYRMLDKKTASVIPGTEDGSGPFFSPDGQSIGFFADGKLKRTALNGGAPITVAEASNPRGASWGVDGTIVAALTNTAGLYAIPVSGGSPHPLTQLGDGEVTHRWPQVLPGGQAVLFTASKNLSEYESASLEVVTRKTGEIKVLQQGGYFGRSTGSGHLLYVHDGTLFALGMDAVARKTHGQPVPILDDIAASSTSAAGQFDVSQTGIFVYQSGKAQPETWSIEYLDATGSTKNQPQLSKPGAYFTPRFSPDGRRLALAMETKGVDIFLYDFQADVLSRLTFFGELSFNPVWTPDAKHLVFRFGRGDSQALMWVRSDGAGAAQKLLDGKALVEPQSISPDGRQLAYQQRSGSNFDIWTMPIDITDPDRPKPGVPEPFARTTANEVQPAFSTDGRWIAYQSDESGVYEVYVRPSPHTSGGGKWQISTGGGKMPVWSRDGKNIFFESLDNRIMVASYTINGISFLPGKASIWSNKHLNAPSDDQNFDLAPDGTRIEALVPSAATEETKASRHITFLLNFFDELRRRVPTGK